MIWRLPPFYELIAAGEARDDNEDAFGFLTLADNFPLCGDLSQWPAKAVQNFLILAGQRMEAFKLADEKV